MTLFNFSAYLHYESGIFYVNVYIDILYIDHLSTLTEFKSLFTSYIFSLLEKEFICMGQSLHACAQIFPSSLFL